jgi:amino acid permease
VNLIFGGPLIRSFVIACQAELSGDAFALMGMAERGFVPKIFGKRSEHGTPTYSILLGLAVIIVMGTSKLDTLIEMLNFNYALKLIMEYCAFVKLRISKPEGMLQRRFSDSVNLIFGGPYTFLCYRFPLLVARPFRIPLGTVGCALFFTPPIIATLLIMGLASFSTLVFSFGCNLVGILLYFWNRGYFRTFSSYSPLQSVPSKDESEFALDEMPTPETIPFVPALV